MKITNKTISYTLKADDENGKMQLLDDAADVQLPSIEKTTDSIKGAGIMGEIDFPSYGQIGNMSLTINNRADNPKYAVLSRPGAIKIEIVWLNDVFDANSIKIGIQQNKVFITCLNKKYDPGKIEVGAAMEGSSEYEVIQYRKVVDGKEVLLVDKLNFKYVINGKDYMDEIRAALQ